MDDIAWILIIDWIACECQMIKAIFDSPSLAKFSPKMFKVLYPIWTLALKQDENPCLEILYLELGLSLKICVEKVQVWGCWGKNEKSKWKALSSNVEKEKCIKKKKKKSMKKSSM